MGAPKHLSGRQAEGGYLQELSLRLGDSVGEKLVGVYVGGSWALGDYRRGRSDLDVAAVVETALKDEIKREIAAAVRHESLPCPAPKLELVVYGLETAGSADARPDFELNLNSGRGVELRLDLSPAPAESHWFPIDRSILAQAGRSISGPPAEQVFAAIGRAAMLPALAASIAWHGANPGCASDEDATLNAYRALRFASEGRWSSKSAAAEWALAHGAVPRGQALDALAARRSDPLRR